MKKIQIEDLRSRKWFMNADNREMTALYLERYLNYGLTRKELQSGKPIIGIAQTGSDLSPCNRHHLELTKRVRDGIIAAGGTPIEIPVHPIQETGKRPTAMLDRNLAYLSLVETLFGYPLDGVVLNIGCDKTTPALLMAAATVNIPAIALSVGPMLNGWFNGERTGSGTIVWKAREMLASGDIDDDGLVKVACADGESGQNAIDRIKEITADVEVDQVYDGKVIKILDFGAIISLLPGKDGLLHISQIAHERIKAVKDHLSEGDEVKVKVIEVDDKGRVRVSAKALIEPSKPEEKKDEE